MFLKNDCFWFSKVKSDYIWQVRWRNVSDVDVKFSQDLTYQILLKFVGFWLSCLKNKKVEHGVVMIM